MDEQLLLSEDMRSKNISWSAYNADEQIEEKQTDISVLLPLFQEDSKSIAMIKHSMDVVKQPVDHLDTRQSPVIAFGQPLFTLAKLVQWNWSDLYGEKKFVIMMGALHIEMAFLKTIGTIVMLHMLAALNSFC